MKKKVLGILFVTVTVMCVWLAVSAETASAASGFYNIGTHENVTIVPKSSSGDIKTINADVDGDGNSDVFYSNSDILTVTYSAAINDAYYGVILVEGDAIPTKDNAIYYVDQLEENSGMVEFKVFPRNIDGDYKLTLYISSSIKDAELVSVPLNYIKDFEVIESISIVTPPSKIEYTAFETFDKTGMKVTTVNEVGEEIDVTDECVVDTTTKLSVSDTEWIVTYKGQTAKQPIVVNPKGIVEADFEFDLSDKTYTGSAITPAVTSTTLISGADYVVTYENNTNVGTATIKVTGTGNYTGEIVKAFTIVGNQGDLPSETSISISVGNATARKGQEVVIPISISDNVGLTGLQLDCNYDDILTLTKVETGSALNDLQFTAPGDLSSNPVTLLWDGMEVDTTNGEIVILTFKIDDNAIAGDYDISLTVKTACDQNLDEVDVKTTKGKVSVIEHVPGNVNDDEEIDVKDIILIRRHIAGGYGVSIIEEAADVDASGEIDTRDIILLRRYIAGGYGIVLK